MMVPLHELLEICFQWFTSSRKAGCGGSAGRDRARTERVRFRPAGSCTERIRLKPDHVNLQEAQAMLINETALRRDVVCRRDIHSTCLWCLGYTKVWMPSHINSSLGVRWIPQSSHPRMIGPCFSLSPHASTAGSTSGGIVGRNDTTQKRVIDYALCHCFGFFALLGRSQSTKLHQCDLLRACVSFNPHHNITTKTGALSMLFACLSTVA